MNDRKEPLDFTALMKIADAHLEHATGALGTQDLQGLAASIAGAADALNLAMALTKRQAGLPAEPKEWRQSSQAVHFWLGEDQQADGAGEALESLHRWTRHGSGKRNAS